MNITGGTAQLYRVVMNLVTNARDAMQDIGLLNIRTENFYADDSTIQFGRVPRGEYIRLSVTDTGCGIPDDLVERIFDPYFTTKSADKKRGSGLGLRCGRCGRKDHGGYLDLTTRVGHGSTFSLYFPIVRGTVSGSSTDKGDWRYRTNSGDR
ncbi:MAG: hypothetical protein IPH75_07800 [bacterium]|nr:hypothetical protein [bacterium]